MSECSKNSMLSFGKRNRTLLHTKMVLEIVFFNVVSWEIEYVVVCCSVW